MSNEHDSWIEGLGVTSLKSLGDDSENDGESVTSGQAADSKQRRTSSTLVMDPPIGALPMLSSSTGDSSGRVFTVVVASSAKDTLLFAASVSGKSVGTVKISLPAVVITLKDVLITSINVSGPGANILMTLESSSRAEFSD
jgi:hypothetical protein